MVVQDFKEKWALVLGGSSGLGLATAQKLALEGMNVCIVHRSRRSVLSAFEEAVSDMETHGQTVLHYNIDAMNSTKRAELVQELLNKVGEGQFKTMVHSIARGNLKPLFSETEKSLGNEDFKLTLDAMAVSLQDWVSAFAKANLFSKDARVVAFTSEGSTRAWHQYGAVAAAKAALESIVRGIALEYASLGLKANCIQAGVTDTESLRLIPGSDVMKEMALKRNPHKRLTTPKDVANAVFLLCTNEASWITGSVIPVDGGEHIR